MTRSTN